jgi:hypothetical protein
VLVIECSHVVEAVLASILVVGIWWFLLVLLGNLFAGSFISAIISISLPDVFAQHGIGDIAFRGVFTTRTRWGRGTAATFSTAFGRVLISIAAAVVMEVGMVIPFRIPHQGSLDQTHPPAWYQAASRVTDECEVEQVSGDQPVWCASLCVDTIFP